MNASYLLSLLLFACLAKAAVNSNIKQETKQKILKRVYSRTGRKNSTYSSTESDLGDEKRCKVASPTKYCYKFVYGFCCFNGRLEVSDNWHSYEQEIGLSTDGNFVVFQTDSLDNLLFFPYALKRCLPFINTGTFKETVAQEKLVMTLQTIMDTIGQIPHQFMPFYCTFQAVWTKGNRGNGLKKYLYFILTTISYSLSSNQIKQFRFDEGDQKSQVKMNEDEILKPIVSEALNQLKNYSPCSLQTHLIPVCFELFKSENCEQIATPSIWLDYSEVSFIYHQSKESPIERTKQIHQSLWRELKNSISTKELKNDPNCYQTKFTTGSNQPMKRLDRYVRRLYQEKFIQLLSFPSSLSIDEFISKYLELKEDFSQVIIDFRFKLLYYDEFDEILNGIERIAHLIEITSMTPVTLKYFNLFLAELVQFINYKYVLFNCDIYIEEKFLAKREFTNEASFILQYRRQIEQEIKLQRVELEEWRNKFRVVFKRIEEQIKIKPDGFPFIEHLHDQILGGNIIISLNQSNLLVQSYLRESDKSCAQKCENDSTVGRAYKCFLWCDQFISDLPKTFTTYEYSWLIGQLSRMTDMNDLEVDKWVDYFADSNQGFFLLKDYNHSNWSMEEKRKFLEYLKVFLQIHYQ